MRRKGAIPHDPFHDPAPQVSNVYQYEEPPELRPLDEDQGGLNSRPLEITDEHFDSDFDPPPVPDLNFSRKGRK